MIDSYELKLTHQLIKVMFKHVDKKSEDYPLVLRALVELGLICDTEHGVGKLNIYGQTIDYPYDTSPIGLEELFETHRFRKSSGLKDVNRLDRYTCINCKLEVRASPELGRIDTSEHSNERLRMCKKGAEVKIKRRKTQVLLKSFKT